MRKHVKIAIVVSAVLVGWCAAAFATIYPPENYRDPTWAPDWFLQCTGFKSWADWSFDTPGPVPDFPPDNQGWNWVFHDAGDSAMGDLPQSHESPYVRLTGNATWIGAAEGRQGIVGGTAPVDFHVWMDNEQAPLVKQVWLQFDMWAAPDWPTTMSLMVSYPTDVGIQKASPILFPAPPTLPDGWIRVTAYWEIPQPEWEQIEIVMPPSGQYLLIDNLKLATQCVPEPAALVLLVTGGMVLSRRRGG
jgi:hypothetical protein